MVIDAPAEVSCFRFVLFLTKFTIDEVYTVVRTTRNFAKKIVRTTGNVVPNALLLCLLCSQCLPSNPTYIQSPLYSLIRSVQVS